jgi:hypothetical protein
MRLLEPFIKEERLIFKNPARTNKVILLKDLFALENTQDQTPLLINNESIITDGDKKSKIWGEILF